MDEKTRYERPQLVEYGTVYGLTKGNYKTFGPGDGMVLIDDQGNIIGPIRDAGSAFH